MNLIKKCIRRAKIRYLFFLFILPLAASHAGDRAAGEQATDHATLATPAVSERAVVESSRSKAQSHLEADETLDSDFVQKKKITEMRKRDFETVRQVAYKVYKHRTWLFGACDFDARVHLHISSVKSQRECNEKVKTLQFESEKFDARAACYDEVKRLCQRYHPLSTS